MIFYSGFSFTEEEALFKTYLRHDAYTVAGFSYGAIKALQHVLASETRIDRLQLISPAFFNDKPEKFKRLQMMGYGKDKEAYLQAFSKLCFEPHDETAALKRSDTSSESLEELLYYAWEPKLLEAVNNKGTAIEVYLGMEDRIVNASAAAEFFQPHATVFLIKNANHFLLER